jgi:hypothetical protein
VSAVELTDRREPASFRAGSIDVSDEDTIYARFDCEGQPGMCDGEFTLVGGTGIFENISGGGNYRSRTQLAELATQLGSSAVVGSAEGIAVWSSVKTCLKEARFFSISRKHDAQDLRCFLGAGVRTFCPACPGTAIRLSQGRPDATATAAGRICVLPVGRAANRL